MLYGIFPLRLRHHTSVKDIRADGNPFITLQYIVPSCQQCYRQQYRP